MSIKHKLLFSIYLFLITISAFAQNSEVEPGVLRIKLSPQQISSYEGLKVQTRNGTTITGIKSLDNLSKAYAVNEITRVFRYSPQYEERHRKHGLHLWYEVKYTAKASGNEVIQAFAKAEGVQFAGPVYKPVLFDGKYTLKYIPKSLNKIWNVLPMNDPGLADQWHYNNTGQYGGTPGMDINLFKAWQTEKGSSNITVAVLDQGVDYTHEDLIGNMWINEAEKNGVIGKDDDNNGYIDDIHGFNFTTNYGDVEKGQHGTHVAGTVSATNNNGIGVCGVAGGSNPGEGVRIMSCQILGSRSGNLEEAFIYAADNGALITQNSWGYSYGFGSPESNKILYDAINYFIAEAGNYPGSPMKGGVVIFASGNDNTNILSWPGAYSKVVAVSSLGARGEKADYSNYGYWLDIAAPGGSSNVDRKQGVLSTFPGNKYAYMDGTSMACPHVSGVAALIVSKYGKNGFSNTDLLKHLLTGIRRDIYSIDLNNKYIDSLGIGSSDAFLALAADNKFAPEAIQDLKLDGISQDFAQLVWTVPSDRDDSKPWSFEILYSTEDQFVFAKSLIIENNKNAGETISAEITNLTGLTKYYFTVRAVDRWGNTSENSNIISGTTNEGPVTKLNPESLNLTVLTNQSKTGQNSFSVSNLGLGVLRYTISKYHVSSVDKYSATDVVYPRNNNFAINPGHKLASQEVPAIPQINPFAQKPINPARRAAYCSFFGGWIIGEADTSLTNSAALRFYVGSDNGFNLTNVEAQLKLNPAKGKAVVEIYQGEDIASAKLIHAQNYGTSYPHTVMSHNIKLENQIYFPKGTYFWIVIHTPSGQLYPLGANYEYSKGYAQNAYMSNNMGKNWSKLVDVYWDTRLVWQIAAVSNYEPVENYVTLSKDKGTIASNGTPDNIQVNVNAANLVNGTYKENLTIYTNEPSKPIFKLPFTIKVENQKPELVVPDLVDFGSVVIGTEKTIEVVLPNVGLGKFKSVTVTYSNNGNRQFATQASPFEIPAQGQGSLKIKYTPTIPGVNSQIVTIKGKDQNIPSQNVMTYSFVINAVAVEPAVVTLSPESVTWADKKVGDILNGSVTVTNEGSYPLKYFVSQKNESNTQVSQYVHKYGYTFESKPEAYNWTDISASGIDITSKISGSVISTSLYQIPLGFAFPFFGKNEDSIYVSRIGVLAFDLKGKFNMMPYSYKQGENDFGSANPERSICPLGSFNFDLTKGGKVYYKKFIDKFIVQYEAIPFSIYGMDDLLTFQVVLYENGDIHFYYKSIPVSDPWSFGNNTLIDIEDLSMDDALPIHVNDYDAPEELQGNIPTDLSAYIITCPGRGIITSIDNSSGVIPAGGSKVVNYTINTSSLTEGDFIEKINFVSNDPVNPVKAHNINLSLTTGGSYLTELSANTLDFGSVAQTGVKQMTLTIKNTGSKNITITDAVINNANYSIIESYTDLKCGRTLPYIIQMNTANVNSNLTGVLTITTNEPKTYTVNLTGVVVEPAKIEAAETSIEQTLASGQTTETTVTIKNTGTGDLEYYPHGNQWIQIDQTTIPSSTLTADYVLTNNLQTENAAVYYWDDITSTGTKLTDLDDPIWAPEKSFKTINLPWEFEYYGHKYTSFSISIRGVVYFFTDDGNSFAYPSEFDAPNPQKPNNYVAPLWVFGTPSDMGAPELSEYAGIYYQIYNDKVIVQFNNMYNHLGVGEPMTVQAILYKNGQIKFQYENTGIGDLQFGFVGMENQDGSKGFQVSKHQTGYILPKMALLFTPLKKHTLAPGTSETLKATVTAEGIYAGTYNGNITCLTNAPGQETFKIPATLTVTGEPAFSSSVKEFNFGDIYTFQTFNQDIYMNAWKDYSKIFFIKNSGTAKMEINSINITNSDPQLVNVQHWALFDGWFDQYYAWADVNDPYINPMVFPYTINPGDSLPLRVRIFDPNYTQSLTGPFSAVNNKLVITGTFSGGTAELPITATPKYPPVINVDRSKIELTTNDPAFVKNELLNLMNEQADGGFDLNYNLSIEYSRKNTAAASVSVQNHANANINILNTNFAKTMLPVMDAKYKTSKAKSYQMSSYNRILEYNTETTPKNSIGYGGTQVFASATAFTAPANGFNLTHVMTWFTCGTSLNSRIRVEIKTGGMTVNDAQTVYTQSFDYTSNAVDDKGKYLTIKLDKNVLLFPNEKFYVIFYYPLQSAFPQGFAAAPQVIENRYYYLMYNYVNETIKEVWTDLTTVPDFASASYMVKAMEETYQASGWVVLNSETSGSIPATLAKNIDLKFNAAGAEQGLNKAKLIIKSNDSLASYKTVDLSLYLNQSPKFDCGNVLNLAVKENAAISYKVKLADYEKNAFTITVDAMPRLVSSVVTNTVEFTYSPNFDDAGVHTFYINGRDEFGASTKLPVNITVEPTNRAPIAKAVAAKTLYTNNEPLRIKANEVFSDPDGDAMIYSAKTNNKFLEVATSEDGYVITPLSNGTTTITLSATDINNAVTTVDFNVTVVVNHAPVAGTVKDMTIVLTSPVKNTNLSIKEAFNDQDKDNLIYTVKNADTLIAKTVLKDNTIDITPVNIGNTLVTVMAGDGKGGYAATNFVITVIGTTTAPEGQKIIADEVFSPNGDGINDNWKIDVPQSYDKCNFYIYNASGEQVFSSFGYANQWNGMDNGNKLPVGTYYYVIKFPDGSIATGTIALVR